METTMNRIKSFIAVSAFSLLVLGLPAVASAQWGGNGGYDPYGGYGNARYNRDIRGTVENLRNSARNFERQVDRGNNGYGRYNDRYNNGNLRNLADRFTDATKDLANAYGRGRNLSNSSDEARRVLDIGSQIENELSYNSRGSYNLQNDWNRVRYDLRVIADTYGYNYNNRGYRNNRNTRTGTWRDRVPFPLPF
jgi:hypothetical protein